MKRGIWMRLTKGAGILLMFGGAVFGCSMSSFIFPGLNCYAFPWGCTACPVGILQNFFVFRFIPFYPVAMITGAGLLAGRGWCGWFCPFGTLQDHIGIRKIKGSFFWMKYAFLTGTLFSAYLFQDTLFCKICPAGTLEGTIPNILLGIATINPASTLHIIVFVVIMGASLLILRFWCRFLCPMAAIFGLFNRITPLQIEFNESKCLHCNLCSGKCPQGLNVPKEVNKSDCIKCGKCTVCDALKMKYSLPKKAIYKKARL